jgi:hypothetical protein
MVVIITVAFFKSCYSAAFTPKKTSRVVGYSIINNV